MLGAGIGADGLQYSLSEESLARIGVTNLEETMSSVVDLLAQIEEEDYSEPA